MIEPGTARKGGALEPGGVERRGRAFDQFLQGCRGSLPLGVGVATYGLVFGVLARQAGLSVIEVVFMSGLVFTGSAQFVALTLWGPAPPIFAVTAATFIVNLRYILMGRRSATCSAMPSV